MKRLAILLLFTVICIKNICVYSDNLKQVADKEYMSNSSITSLCQNHRGVMWIGTCDGLNIYDGRRVETLKIKHGEGDYFSGNLIDNIVYSGNDVYWIQTYYGLNRLDRRTNEVVHFDEFQKHFFMTTDKSGTLFVLKDDNCVYYYCDKERRFEKLNVAGVPVSDVLDFFIDEAECMWIVMKGYSCCLDVRRSDGEDDRIVLQPHKEHFTYRKPLAYCFNDGRAFFYVDADSDLYAYHIKERKREFIANLKDDIRQRGRITSVVRFYNDYFVSFLVNGVIRLEKEGIGYKSFALPIKSGVFCLKKDLFQDVVWIGTDGKGVYLYSNSQYSIRSVVLDNYKGMIGCPVRALFLDDEGTFWLGTKGNGILKISDFRVDANVSDYHSEMLTHSNSGLGSNSVYCFSKSRRGVLWIGDEEGLNYWSYREKRIKKLPLRTADGVDFKYVHDIYEEDERTLWLASVGMGIMRLRISGSSDNPTIDEVRRYVINGGAFDSNYFFSIYADKRGNLLFGNKGYGAYRFNKQTDGLEALAIHKNESMTLNNILDISGDEAGNYLFGTSYGLIKYASDASYKLFNARQGFLNNTIHAVMGSDASHFWLSTNMGLILFDSKRDAFRTYGFGDGLEVLEFSDGATYRDAATGTLFFGGINGFVSVREDGRPENAYMPPVYFDRLSIFGADCSWGDFASQTGRGEELRLKHNQNFFSVSFTSVDYLTGNNCTFFYKLKGLSDQWVDNGASQTLSFTNMSPGEYTLLVKYRNNVFGQESEVYPLHIYIAPPWYASWWAYVLYVLLALSAIAWCVRSFVLRSRRKKRELLKEIERKHQRNVFESKLRFFMSIAREFCTPLTLIYGPCERILSVKGLSKLVTDYVQMIQTNAERLNALIHELIEFRHIETGGREPRIEKLDVARLLKELARTFVELARSRHIVFLSKIPESVSWNSDKVFLDTIFVNVISSAFRSVPDGKSVKMELCETDGNLVFRIAYEGDEMAQEEMKRIFSRYGGLENYGGLGDDSFSRNALGLAMAYKMVQLLQGTLEVAKTEEGWNSLVLSLPQREETAGLVEMRQVISEYVLKTETRLDIQLPQYEFDKMRPVMLVLENDVEMLWFIGEIFSEEFNVIPVREVCDVERMLGEVFPHIVICDDTMPGLDCTELVKHLKANKETAHIPVIVLSGQHDMEAQMEVLEAGAEAFVPKPFSADYLRISVRQVMERKEILKDYFSSPISSFEKVDGKLTHKESKKFLQSVLKVINDNITDRNLTPRFIAEKLAMSSRSLYRRMEEIGEGSPTDLIRDSRLHVAKDLLLTTKKTIDEVVFDSGFSNKVTFFKVFKEKYGCTPKEFRTKHLDNIC